MKELYMYRAIKNFSVNGNDYEIGKKIKLTDISGRLIRGRKIADIKKPRKTKEKSPKEPRAIPTPIVDSEHQGVGPVSGEVIGSLVEELPEPDETPEQEELLLDDSSDVVVETGELDLPTLIELRRFAEETDSIIRLQATGLAVGIDIDHRNSLEDNRAIVLNFIDAELEEIKVETNADLPSQEIKELTSDIPTPLTEEELRENALTTDSDVELEEIGRIFGIEVDRRKSIEDIRAEVLAVIDAYFEPDILKTASEVESNSDLPDEKTLGDLFETKE